MDTKILLQFCRKIWSEQAWGSVAIALLLVAASVATFLHASFSNPAISFPQIGLGLALYAVAGVLIGLALLSFKAGLPASDVKAEAVPVHPTLGVIDTDDALRKVVRVYINSDGEGVSFWKNGADGEVRAYLHVINFAPFSIEFERIIGEIVVRNASVGKLQHLNRVHVDACSEKKVYVQADLTAEQVNKVQFQLDHARSLQIDNAGFRLLVYVEQAGRRIELTREAISGNVRFVNFHLKK